ncbi:MAG: PepSY domain-containing protein [Methylococcaceae bacterium]|nr:PepSY domain-containing protein [Methylococcaceae bacterium]
MNRSFWVLLHRYAGLMMALFLIIIGLTGSILAFYEEIDDWLNPLGSHRHTRIAVQVKPLLDPFDLCDRALKLAPHARITNVDLNPKQDEAYTVALEPSTNPSTGQPYELGYSKLKLNPYTGGEVENSRDNQSSEQTGYFPLTRKNVLDFIYALHCQLALGETGALLFGIIALAWTLDCFVGFYLTLPKGRSKHPATTGQQVSVAKQPSFWQRWKPAWQIKPNASAFRLNFDLHRAFGLWTWAILFIFAWSSVMFMLPEVYEPVMKVFFETAPEQSQSSEPATPQFVSIAEFRYAHIIGKRLMAEQAKRHGFAVHQESLLSYDDATGLFEYIVTSNRDVSQAGQTGVTFNADTGALVKLDPPATGELSGVTVQYWLMALHMASSWGLPYKLFVCFMGLVITMLSVTGIYIWYKKNRAARLKRKGVT